MSLQVFMCWYLLTTLALVGVYDVYAVLLVGGNSTVSWEVYNLGKRFPMAYLFLGMIIGHIILPLHIEQVDPILPLSKKTNETP